MQGGGEVVVGVGFLGRVERVEGGELQGVDCAKRWLSGVGVITDGTEAAAEMVRV